MAPPAFYAVVGGRTPGVYPSWAEALAHGAQGQPGASCKKFKTREEADAHLSAGSAPGPGRAAAPVSGPPVGQLSPLCLECPFSQKDEVKALGAKWDPAMKKWYVPPHLDAGLFERWRPTAASIGRRSGNAKKRSAPEDRSGGSTSAGCSGRPQQPAGFPRTVTPASAPGTLELYTDGACIGNNHVAMNRCPAGWGVAVVVEDAMVAELYGPVVLDPAAPGALGATVGSNNTAELSAVCEALLWLLEFDPNQRAAAIMYDSEYAAGIASGTKRAYKNLELAGKAQLLVRQVRSQRNLRWVHVKGHSGHRWNDRADYLANLGAQGKCCAQGRWAALTTGGSAARQEWKEPCSMPQVVDLLSDEEGDERESFAQHALDGAKCARLNEGNLE